jgi:hypothetical protein
MSSRKYSFQLNDYPNHIIEAITRIEEYTVGLTYAAFCQSTRDQDAVIRNFEVIGEACNNIDRNFPGLRPGTPRVADPVCVRCGMRCHTVTLASISRLCGRRSIAIFRS